MLAVKVSEFIKRPWATAGTDLNISCSSWRRCLNFYHDNYPKESVYDFCVCVTYFGWSDHWAGSQIRTVMTMTFCYWFFLFIHVSVTWRAWSRSCVIRAGSESSVKKRSRPPVLPSRFWSWSIRDPIPGSWYWTTTISHRQWSWSRSGWEMLGSGACDFLVTPLMPLEATRVTVTMTG